MQYNIINYSYHTVDYIPMSYLFHNRKFVPFDLLHPFAQSSSHSLFACCPSPPLETTSLFSESMNLAWWGGGRRVVSFFFFFSVFLDSRSICLSLSDFTQDNTLKAHPVVKNDNIPCVCVLCVSLFITALSIHPQWALRSLPHLGCWEYAAKNQ